MARRRAVRKAPQEPRPCAAWSPVIRPVQDSLFLALVVVLSLAPYVADLGFYGDDWEVLTAFVFASDPSLAGLVGSVSSNLAEPMRPVKIAYAAALYRLFGLEPLGYHLINGAMLAGAVVLFGLALHGLGQSRVVCLAVPAVYGLLPHYSTDRFVFAAFQATLSMTLYFLSLRADLVALAAPSPRAWAWKALALASLVASGLSDEVALPLFLLHPFLVWWRVRALALAASRPAATGRRAAVSGGLTLLALAPTVWLAALTTARSGPPGLDPWEAVRIGFGEYGVGLPRVLWRIARDHPNAVMFLLAGVVAALVFAYLHAAAWEARPRRGGRAPFAGLIAVGLVVFALGHAVFLVTPAVIDTATGIGNRTAIAAAAGVALALVGGLGWGSGLLPRGWRTRAFCALVAGLCAGGFVVVNTLASFWVAAARQQQAVLEDLRQRVPLPRGATLILDGVCQYAGPAIVFEAARDLTGAVRVLYRDPTLAADIVNPTLAARADGLATSLFGEPKLYPYGNLVVYHYGRKVVSRLDDADAARRYFAGPTPASPGGCPPGRVGHGVPVF